MFNLDPPPSFRGLDPNQPVRIYYRHLPHWRQDGATYFVTFRLNDALPQAKIRELQALKADWEARHPKPRSAADWEPFARAVMVRTERWLDEGHGSCLFRQSNFAQLLSDAILHFHGQRHFTACFTVMPNHCHLIIAPYLGHELEELLQICKGFVAREINRALHKTGPIWQQESYDRIIRDEEHLYQVIQYIGRNPGRAGIPRDQWVRWIDPSWKAAGWDFEE